MCSGDIDQSQHHHIPPLDPPLSLLLIGNTQICQQKIEHKNKSPVKETKTANFTVV